MKRWPGPEALRARLFEQRIVSLRGTLDDEVAGLVCAELMTLDASGDSAITLFVDSGEATLSAAFSVMDTIDLLGVPVHATCMGRAGPAVGGSCRGPPPACGPPRPVPSLGSTDHGVGHRRRPRTVGQPPPTSWTALSPARGHPPPASSTSKPTFTPGAT